VLSAMMPLVAMAAVPTTTSISPSAAVAGDAAITLTVSGSGFDPAAVVNFSGSARPTTYISSNQLTASIPASALANIGTFNVTVTNPGTGGGTSNAQMFTVMGTVNPVPVLTMVSPLSSMAGSSAFTLTVNGSNFNAYSVIRFNGLMRTTTYVSPTQLTAFIPASDSMVTGQYVVDVINPAPGGGTSAFMLFTVNPVSGAPVPTLPNTGFGPTQASTGVAVAIALFSAVAVALVAKRALSAR